MKNTTFYLPFLLLGLLPFTACKNNCDKGDFSIRSIQPAANPVGYEIFIACTGVSANTKVRFDEVEAASVKTAEGGLIAKIPTGVAGTVSLSIEEGDCSDSKPFDVLGSYPANTPAGPTTVIIPQNPGGYPPDITNFWRNVADSLLYGIQLTSDFPGHLLMADDEDGTNGGSIERYFGTGNDLLKNNPVSGTYDTLANTIFIVIDRSAKVGGYKDTLTGSFIPNLPSPP